MSKKSTCCRAHTKYDAKVMFSAFLSFWPQGEPPGGGKGGDQKLKNVQTDGKYKKKKMH